MSTSKIAILFGNKVKELRNAKQMSQEELAYRASISSAHLGQIERAKKNPTLKTMYQISNALETPLQDLFADSSIQVSKYHMTTTSDKILLHLKNMSEYQQKDILRLIRIVEKFPFEDKNKQIDSKI